eukprot:RCo037183
MLELTRAPALASFELQLLDNCAGDEGLLALTQTIARRNSLTSVSLSLGLNQITDKGVSMLSALKVQAKHIDRLSLDLNPAPGVSLGAMEWLRNVDAPHLTCFFLQPT